MADYVRPICLDNSPSVNGYVGDDVVLTGWGRVSDGIIINRIKSVTIIIP